MQYVVTSANPNLSHSQVVNIAIKEECQAKDPEVSRKEFRKSLRDLESSLYVGSFRAATFQTSAKHYDISIGNQFVQEWDSWANGTDVAKRRSTEELRKELQNLFGYEHLTIQVPQQKDCLILNTDDGSFRLDELGVGISHFIVVLINALILSPGFILIDEPETGLHPRLQETFVRTLASKARLGTIASSHSVGLARSVADRIYTLTREPSGRHSLVPFGQHQKTTLSQSIAEMGYSQFVELGGNNLLLVEGRTDVKAFRELLRLYGIESKFIIWSFGGGEFITADSSKICDELAELKRLNPRSISVICDSERGSSGAALSTSRQCFVDTCTRVLGFNVFVTDLRATENYVTADALKKVFGNRYKPLGPFEKFGSCSDAWDKNKNWLLFREMTTKSLESTQLHRFILDTLTPRAKQGGDT